MNKLCQGRIIWIAVPDKNGNRKEHPVIILTATDEIPSEDELVTVVCSHSAAKKNPLPDHHVSIPYQRQGRTRTKLKKETVAICDWLVRIKTSTLESVPEDDIGGVVPGRVLELVAEQIREIRAQKQGRGGQPPHQHDT